MILNDEWIREYQLCKDGIKWLLVHPTRDAVTVIEDLLKEKNKEWVLWALPRCLNRKNKIFYSVFSSELVLPNYAAFNPDTSTLIKCHQAARAVAENDTEENRSAAESAAWSAARSAWSAAESEEKRLQIKGALRIIERKN
jgi:hypothetical protein